MRTAAFDRHLLPDTFLTGWNASASLVTSGTCFIHIILYVHCQELEYTVDLDTDTDTDMVLDTDTVSDMDMDLDMDMAAKVMDTDTDMFMDIK